MAGEQTTAIVLRITDFSETSLVVTLMTRDFGRLTGLAKGAYRPKGPFEGALDLLAVCRVVVIRKNSNALDLLTEAKLQRRFRGAEKSLDRVYAGYYIAEMLRLFTDDNDPHPDLYDLTLRALTQIDGDGPIASTLACFDAQVLRLLGHAPATQQCTHCGQQVRSTARIAFSMIGGGVVCGNCRSRQQSTVSVRREVIEEMQRLLSPQTTLPTRVAPDLYGELRAVMSRYIQNLLGTKPRMQAFLPTAIRTEPTA